jgi:hypothetical protein
MKELSFVSFGGRKHDATRMMVFEHIKEPLRQS